MLLEVETIFYFIKHDANVRKKMCYFKERDAKNFFLKELLASLMGKVAMVW
ncbi:MAG: hypothetical protein WKF87_15035 [Chryseolinea sp.]